MIPKIIHYCWISGENNMPDDIKKCIESWHKYLPDYEFINWNDSNFDWNICEFTKQCRQHNSYAFCSDYIRFWALYNYGGIYLDTDVEVFRSFNDLIESNSILTVENAYKNKYYETAILGVSKDNLFLNKVLKDCLDYYGSLDTYYSFKTKYDTSPSIFTRIINNAINNSSEEYGKDLGVLDWRLFNELYPKAYAEHKFKNSWLDKNFKVTGESDISIFVCCHTKFDTTKIPKNKAYILISQSREVVDNDHEVIYIDDDQFTKTHWRCYSEGCAMRYLYNHPELLKNIVGIYHYRRLFTEFFDKEIFIAHIIQEYGTIRQVPFEHSITDRKTNKGGMFLDHPKAEAQAFIDSVKEVAPEYWDTFQELLDDHLQYGCNILLMTKEDYLEMCEMCFRVLDHYDKKQKFTNNQDVLFKMMEYEKLEQGLRYDIIWQSRLQGFWLEWLTELYARQKYGVKNMYLSKVGI